MRHVVKAHVAALACVVISIQGPSAPAQAPPVSGGAGAPGDPAPPAGTATSDPAEILSAMRTTLAAAGAFSYRSTLARGAEGSVNPRAKSQTTLRHAADGKVTGIRVKGSFQPKGPVFDAASDGERLRACDLDSRIFQDMSWSGRGARKAPQAERVGSIGEFRIVIPAEFWNPNELEIRPTDVLRPSTPESVDGVSCDVIELDREAQAIIRDGTAPEANVTYTLVTRYAIGRIDHLPRRITRRSPPRGPPATVDEHVFSEWQIDPAVDNDTFMVNVAGMQEGTFTVPELIIPVETSKKSERKPEIKPGDTPPDFETRDVTGRTFKFSSYKGRPTLVNFPAEDVEACDPLLTKLQAKHGDRLVILEVVVGQAGEDVESMKKLKAVAYPRLMNGKAIADSWGVHMFPSGILVGPDGKMVTRIGTSMPVAPGKGSDPSDALVRRMANWLKSPAKGW